MKEERKLSAVFTFLNEDGNKVTMTITPCRSDLEKADLEGFMDVIIAENCFTSKGGDLVSKVKAQILDVVTEKYSFEQ